jgi:hypothetical protein
MLKYAKSFGPGDRRSFFATILESVPTSCRIWTFSTVVTSSCVAFDRFLVTGDLNIILPFSEKSYRCKFRSTSTRSYVLEYLDSEIRAKSENGAKFWSRFTPVAIFAVKAFLDILWFSKKLNISYFALFHLQYVKFLLCIVKVMKIISRASSSTSANWIYWNNVRYLAF